MRSLNLIKTAAAILVLSVAGSTLKAQENKTVALSNYSEVTVSSGIDLYLSQSNSENIKVTAHADLIKNVVVEKSGNNLIIKYKDNISWGRLFKNQSIKVYVNYKTLNAITASGGSDVYTQNTLKTNKLIAQASGGSDMELNVVAKDIEIRTSGGSDLDLKGSAVNMIAQASGGSDIDAYGFIVEYAKVTASGGSDANVHVTKALEANASGGSDINYKGDASLKKTSSKSSDVNKVQ